MSDSTSYNLAQAALKYSSRLTDKARVALRLRRKLIKELDERMCFIDDKVDPLTGEWTIKRIPINNVKNKDFKAIFEGSNLEHVSNFIQRLGYNQTLYAVHETSNGKESQALITRYSMHALCPLWSWRKSRIIRKKYIQFFEKNENLFNEFVPCHLVLTLRHNDTGYFIHDNHIESRFYARELINIFTNFRKNHSDKSRMSTDFTRFFTGGTYNIEVKKSEKNGLHIHMHCLVLVPIDEFEQARAFIKREWKAFTGADQVILDKLYYRQGEHKFEFDKSTWTKEQTAHAIMEALKYQFKGDEYLKQDGKPDLEYLEEILSNQKNLRFYSRFGSLYNVKALSFNYDEPDEYAQDLKDLMKYNNDVLDSEELFRHLEIFAKKHKQSLESAYNEFVQAKKVKDFDVKDACLIDRYVNCCNPETGELDQNFTLYLGFPAYQKKKKEDQAGLIFDKKHLFEVNRHFNRVEVLPELYKVFYTTHSEGLLKKRERKRFFWYFKNVQSCQSQQEKKKQQSFEFA